MRLNRSSTSKLFRMIDFLYLSLWFKFSMPHCRYDAVGALAIGIFISRKDRLKHNFVVLVHVVGSTSRFSTFSIGAHIRIRCAFTRCLSFWFSSIALHYVLVLSSLSFSEDLPHCRFARNKIAVSRPRLLILSCDWFRLLTPLLLENSGCAFFIRSSSCCCFPVLFVASSSFVLLSSLSSSGGFSIVVGMSMASCWPNRCAACKQTLDDDRYASRISATSQQASFFCRCCSSSTATTPASLFFFRLVISLSVRLSRPRMVNHSNNGSMPALVCRTVAFISRAIREKSFELYHVLKYSSSLYSFTWRHSRTETIRPKLTLFFGGACCCLVFFADDVDSFAISAEGILSSSVRTQSLMAFDLKGAMGIVVLILCGAFVSSFVNLLSVDGVLLLFFSCGQFDVVPRSRREGRKNFASPCSIAHLRIWNLK